MSDRFRPRAVVFDLDGLMFNTEELYQEVGREMLKRRGHDFTSELLDAMMGRPSPVALQIMIDWHGLTDTVEILSNETDEIFKTILPLKLLTMPGLLPLLETLEKADIPKAIATSSRRAFVTNVLSRFDLEPRFEFILSAEDVREGKPKPEIYQTAASRFGVTPSEIVVFEDSQNGCRAGVAAGARVVAVPGPPSMKHDFGGCAFIATSLADPRVYDLLDLPEPVAE